MKTFHLGIYGILLKNGSLLLVRKSRGPYTGLLDLPGGRPEHGESLFDTLIREVQEETGVKIETSSLFDNLSISVPHGDQSMHHTGLLYLIDAYDDSSFVSRSQSDVQEAAWCGLGTIEGQKLTPFALHVTNILKKNPILW